MDKNIVKLLNILNAVIEKKNVDSKTTKRIIEILTVAVNNIRKIK